MKNYRTIILTGCSVIFNIILFIASVSYAQQPDLKLNHSTWDFKQDSTNKHKSGILFSMGAGPSIMRTSFVLSPSITGEIHEHFNLTTGVDFYFRPKYSSNLYVITIIPYYVLRTSNRTIFKIGIGAQVYNRVIGLMISSKFDFEVFHNNYLGVEIKTFVKSPIEEGLFLPILLNYSIRL